LYTGGFEEDRTDVQWVACLRNPPLMVTNRYV
jgi:hypothetical protein